MATVWERNEDVIAERFKREEIEGVFKKKFRAGENEKLVIEKHGEIYKELGSGEFTVSGLLDKDFTYLLIMDRSERVMERTMKNVFLRDERRMDIRFEVKFKVFHSDRFSSNLVRNRKRLFMEDVWADILSNLIYKKSLPEIKKHSAGEFLKEDFREKTMKGIGNDMKKMFRGWGLALTHFSVDFRIPEGGKSGEAEKPTAEAKEEEGKKEPEDIVDEAEAGVIKGESKEGRIAELEKERLGREVEMELEKEETQKDAEEAMEAMGLKEIKDKQEILKKAEEKELGIREEGEKAEDLEKQLEDLRRAKEIAEKKFYKKELSEEAFQRMMEDIEKKIIGIESRLKSRKD
jgi:hypothetical protein